MNNTNLSPTARIIVWLLALVFLASGGAKLASLQFEIDAFMRWGYPLWFMYLTGAIEVAGGLALLIPRLAGLAAAGLALMMTGAIMTHVIHAELAMGIAATVLFSLLVGSAWVRRSTLIALFQHLQRRPVIPH